MMDDDLICYSYDILQHTALYCDLLQYRLYCLLLYLYASGIYIYILYVRVFRSLIALILHCLLVSVFSIDLVVLVCHVRLIETYYWRLLSDIWLLHSLQ